MVHRRVILRQGGRLLLRALVRLNVQGLERVPAEGPLLVAFNHLAHLDGPFIVTFIPREVESLALSDLYEVPVVGQLLRWYGVIPVHRDQFDRTVLRRALAVLEEGRALALAPEARMSVTGALERARHGAAYVALQAAVPILPVALTGTELIPSALRRFHRAPVTMTVGEPYHPPLRVGDPALRRAQVQEVTEAIMLRIAALLPMEYRGEYG
jgi:1-acyl-sn-glycerol-3-phosphate acyltransferase